MCILFWTVDNHPDYRFIFAANRDEFLDRPTAPAHFWPPPNEHVLAGTDLEESATPSHNGTWLGITRDGRFAALTNYRERKYLGLRSRGALTRDYLLQHDSASAIQYMHDLEKRADKYGGFSLICMNLRGGGAKHRDMAYFSNRDDVRITPLSQGTAYGLSNSVLENPWEKVVDGRVMFQDTIRQTYQSEDALIESLFDLLRTTSDTGSSADDEQDAALQLAKAKQNIFIPPFLYTASTYGTRTSTVILVDHEGNTTFVERDHYAAKQPEDSDQKQAYSPVVKRGRTFRFNIDR